MKPGLRNPRHTRGRHQRRSDFSARDLRSLPPYKREKIAEALSRLASEKAKQRLTMSTLEGLARGSLIILVVAAPVVLGAGLVLRKITSMLFVLPFAQTPQGDSNPLGLLLPVIVFILAAASISWALAVARRKKRRVARVGKEAGASYTRTEQ